MGYGILPQFSKKKISFKKQITSFDTSGSLPVLYRFFHALDQWFFDFAFPSSKNQPELTQFLCESGEIKNWIPHPWFFKNSNICTNTDWVCSLHHRRREVRWASLICEGKLNGEPKKKEVCTLKVERERERERDHVTQASCPGPSNKHILTSEKLCVWSWHCHAQMIQRADPHTCTRNPSLMWASTNDHHIQIRG